VQPRADSAVHCACTAVGRVVVTVDQTYFHTAYSHNSPPPPSPPIKAARTPELRRKANVNPTAVGDAVKQAAMGGGGGAPRRRTDSEATAAGVASQKGKAPTGWIEVLSAPPSTEQLEAISTLIGNGMDVNAKCGPALQPPLHLATAQGNTMAMSQLLAMGVRCSVLNTILHSRMLLDPTLARLK
jgi:hypothetical protein